MTSMLFFPQLEFGKYIRRFQRDNFENIMWQMVKLGTIDLIKATNTTRHIKSAKISKGSVPDGTLKFLATFNVNTWYEGGGEQGDWRKEDGEGICGVLLVTLAGKALHGPGPEIVVLGCVSGVFWFENKDSLGDIWGCWPEKQIRN